MADPSGDFDLATLYRRGEDALISSGSLSPCSSLMSDSKSSTSPITPPPNPFNSASLETLGLTPSPAATALPLPNTLSPAVTKRIVVNVQCASGVLEWSDKTTAIASLRASEVWRVERLINEIPCFGLGEADVTDSDVDVVMSNLGISQAQLDEVEKVVRHLSQMSANRQDFVLDPDGKMRVGPKFLSYVAATSESSGRAFLDVEMEELPGLDTAGDIIRAVQKIANAVLRNPRDDNTPRLAALVGLCVSRAWCLNSESVLHLTWIQMVRAMGGVGTSSAHACVAAFFPPNGNTRLGKYAALALTVLSRIEGSVFASFAALHVGTRPGFDALMTPNAALEFLCATLTTAEPICRTIVDELANFSSTLE